MFLIPKLILSFIFGILTLNAFLLENVKVSIKSNQVHRHHVKGAVPLSSSYDVVTVDEEYPRSDATWWQIFADEKKFTPPPPPADEEIKGFSSVLNVNAWRTAFVEEEPVVEKNESPPSLKEYFEGKVLGSKHLENIQGLWRLMRNRGSLKHLDAEDLDRVMEALRVAYISLWGKITMRSLEISINRARGTAAVLGELKTKVNVVLSAILSDVLAELTSTKQREQLSMRFGEDVIRLSESYNKLPVFMSRKAEYTDLQSENQIQMLVLASEDYRVLYIRLADRLHTMRTLRSLPVGDAEKLKIAEEALNVYAPLAHRMGMMKVKGELEDLAFKHLHPEIFQSTKYTQLAANKAYHEAMEAVQLIMTNDTYLSALGVTFRLSYRIKDKYQLFLKMQRKNLSSVSQVRDALGMRIIISGYARIPGETNEAYVQRGSDICYHLVSELRAVEGWVPAERGFKDYIQNAKENGYQSLHQYIKNLALGTNVEIQVRTEAMHKAACLGEAAHWFYKDKIYRPKLVDTKIYRHAWRSPLQTTAKSPEELIGMAKQQLLASRVLVFLEDRSTVLNLVKGDTALDATFALHSDLGLTVTTIRIGGQPVPLDYTLQNGDVVTCESSPGVMSVSPLWLEMAKSSTALSKIRKYFRESNSRILVCLGLVHFLMTLTLSEERISRRYPNGLPSVAKLADFIKIRTPMSITNFADYLERLGGASVSESASLVGSLLDIPVKDLKISSVSLGLFWARMENKNGWGDKVMQKTLLLPILREVLPALNLPHVESLWVELIGSRSLELDDKQEALIPLASLFTSRLGPSRKEYNYVYPYVIQAPAHALHSIPYSSLVSSEGSTLTASQRTSTQAPETSVIELPTESENESENELVSISSSIEEDSLSNSTPEGTVLGILGEVKLTMKPWSSHPISVSLPSGKRSTGMYTKSPHNLTRKSVLPVATLASCSTQQMKNKRITEQISARVRTA